MLVTCQATARRLSRSGWSSIGRSDGTPLSLSLSLYEVLQVMSLRVMNEVVNSLLGAWNLLCLMDVVVFFFFSS